MSLSLGFKVSIPKPLVNKFLNKQIFTNIHPFFWSDCHQTFKRPFEHKGRLAAVYQRDKERGISSFRGHMVPPDDALSFPITAITALSQNITRMPLSPLLRPSPPHYIWKCHDCHSPANWDMSERLLSPQKQLGKTWRSSFAFFAPAANLSDLTWDRGLILEEVMVRGMVQIQDGQKAPGGAWGPWRGGAPWSALISPDDRRPFF